MFTFRYLFQDKNVILENTKMQNRLRNTYLMTQGLPNPWEGGGLQFGTIFLFILQAPLTALGGF